MEWGCSGDLRDLTPITSMSKWGRDHGPGSRREAKVKNNLREVTEQAEVLLWGPQSTQENAQEKHLGPPLRNEGHLRNNGTLEASLSHLN